MAFEFHSTAIYGASLRMSIIEKKTGSHRKRIIVSTICHKTFFSKDIYVLLESGFFCRCKLERLRFHQLADQNQNESEKLPFRNSLLRELY